jgi:hypothetical protein
MGGTDALRPNSQEDRRSSGTGSEALPSFVSLANKGRGWREVFTAGEDSMNKAEKTTIF